MAEVPQDGAAGQNVEPADKYEDEKPTDTPKINGHHVNQKATTSDPDAQEMVISSLRSQIQDLFSQVTELNNKLVKSYDRVSDLEDDLHLASSNIRSSTLKISQLELERTQHLSALNTGLLVEKSHVTAELTRLMEKATEEAAQRGQAESARADIEKDLDDLSATLFSQANSMVAEARYAQHLSERKVDEAQLALKSAEEVIGIMQQQMQALQAEKEKAEQTSEEMQVVMGKGKWTERRDSSIPRTIRLLNSHVPYQEFLLFVSHLRSIHPSSPIPPAMTTLLPLPFLARLLNEDSEPTIRLDLAPSLNWLSRRSVLSAIHNGQLTIEPISSSTLLQESSYSLPTTIPGLNSSNNNIACALCGASIFSTPESSSRPQPPGMTPVNSNSISWSTSLFKKPPHSVNHSMSSNNSQPPTPPRSIDNSSHQLHPSQIHIFRLAAATSSTTSISISSLPKMSSTTASSSTLPHTVDNNTSLIGSPATQQSTTIYPLCTNNWCLARLRATCTLWAFVRTGIVERIWEEEVPAPPPATITPTSTGEKPPIPPRRRGLWGMASALGGKAASWGGAEGDKDKAKKVPSPVLTSVPEKHKEKELKKLPAAPPPTHPTVAAAHVHTNIRHSVPPPLPKRSRIRQPSPTKFTDESENTETSETQTITQTTEPPTVVQTPPPPRSPLRSNTPSNIPLPESRPQTPVIVPTVPGTVPPPLPRRAAARAVRPGGSRPATPGPVSENTAEVSPETKTVGATPPETTGPTEKEPSKSEPSKSEPDQIVIPKDDEKAPGQDIPPEPASETPTLSIDTVTADKPSEKVVADEISPTSVQDDVFVDAEASLDEEKPKVENVKDGGISNGEVMTLDEEKTAEAVSEEPANENAEKDKGTEETVEDKTKESEPDKGSDAYIGDTTWEERTWKELVRLREEMFWARVGALRV